MAGGPRYPILLLGVPHTCVHVWDVAGTSTICLSPLPAHRIAIVPWLAVPLEPEHFPISIRLDTPGFDRHMVRSGFCMKGVEGGRILERRVARPFHLNESAGSRSCLDDPSMPFPYIPLPAETQV